MKLHPAIKQEILLRFWFYFSLSSFTLNSQHRQTHLNLSHAQHTQRQLNLSPAQQASS